MVLPNYKSLINYNVDKDQFYIANCMRYSMQQEVSSVEDNTFNLLCDFAYKIGAKVGDCFNHCVIDYQIITDIVADLYFGYDWGYRDEDGVINVESFETGRNEVPVIRTLTDKDLEEQNYLKVDMAVQIYVDSVYDY